VSWRYGVLYPVPADFANRAHVGAIRQEMRVLSALGVDTVGLESELTSVQIDWETLLGEAAAEGIKVLSSFTNADDSTILSWNGSSYDLGIYETYINAMKNHPAYLGVHIVDEPFHARHGGQFTTTRLGVLWNQILTLAPSGEVLSAWSGEIKKGEEGSDPEKKYKAGSTMVQISAREFRCEGSNKVYQRQDLVDNHTVSRAVVQRDDPTAKIGCSLQVFGPRVECSSSYYFPTIAETVDMVELVRSKGLQDKKKIEFVMWQLWWAATAAQDSGQYSLRDPDSAGHRRLVRKYSRASLWE